MKQIKDFLSPLYPNLILLEVKKEMVDSAFIQMEEFQEFLVA